MLGRIRISLSWDYVILKIIFDKIMFLDYQNKYIKILNILL